jgi:sterol desaturase/sphingolipid hydroxylase (fatty acid hydroxylase superfamily)
MLDTSLVIQIITFIVLVLLFNHLEQRIPGFAVNKRRDLALNIAAMSIVIFGGECAKLLVRAGYNSINLGAVLLGNRVSLLPGAIKIPLTIVLTDFSLYWVHRAIHQPLLWRTHEFHHSIPEIWWLAGSRTSFFHLLFFAVPQVFIGFYLMRLTSLQSGIAISIGIFVNLWIHTNLRVDLGGLERFLVTPNYHRIHHGGQGLASRNMGFVLTLWDHLFGTYLSPRKLGRNYPIAPVPVGKRLPRLMLGL